MGTNFDVMNNTSGQGLHTEGLISDYFVVEAHLLSTRTADAYRAVDKSRQEPITLWMLRHPLALNSDAVKRFLTRMRQISDISPAVSEMSAYGVDKAGVAFAVLPAMDGSAIVQLNLDMAEGERRYTSCLRFVDRLHRAGVACGDLCGFSFWVVRGGDVKFVGVMGSFDAEAVATTMLPPAETIPYFAPEQRSGAGIEMASDVFALGVLGYRLITGSFPYGEGAAALASSFDVSSIAPPSALVPNAPGWADEVLLRCLDADPARRFASAGEIFAAIAQARQSATDRQSAPVPLKKSGAKAQSASSKPLAASPVVQQGANENKEQALSKRTRKAVLGIVGVAALSTILVFTYLGPSGHESARPAQQSSLDHSAAIENPELKKAVKAIGDSEGEVNPAEKKAELEKIVNSDDPLAHDILVRSAKSAKTVELRELSEQAIVDRARRLRLLRSAEQTRQWLKTIRGSELPADYEAVLRSLDTTLPLEARNTFLRQAYATNGPMVMKLAVAIGLDLEKMDDYQPVIAQLVGDSLQLENAAQYSGYALVLAQPELAMVFGEDVIQKKEKIPSGDLLWILKVLADRNDINVRAIASLAVERGVLNPIRSQFLQLVRDRADLPTDVLDALLRAASGALRPSDVGSFGRWYDLEGEKILLALCADTEDPTILVDAFDTLAGRSLTVEPSASLLAWVRRYHWGQRVDFAKMVGIMGNLDKVSASEVAKIFESMNKYARDSDLIQLLLRSGNGVVIKGVLERYPDLISLSGLLTLLGHQDKGVKISAIKALKSYNDIGALKIIVDHYEKEKDPEVRQAYEENFWMIKNREG